MLMLPSGHVDGADDIENGIVAPPGVLKTGAVPAGICPGLKHTANIGVFSDEPLVPTKVRVVIAAGGGAGPLGTTPPDDLCPRKAVASSVMANAIAATPPSRMERRPEFNAWPP
jgi:hypothetical protein